MMISTYHLFEYVYLVDCSGLVYEQRINTFLNKNDTYNKYYLNCKNDFFVSVYHVM
jgi:hypothetical protein